MRLEKGLHLLDYPTVNLILQFNGKELYIHRNERKIRYTKIFISNHPLNHMKRVVCYNYIRKINEKLDKEFLKKKMINIKIGKSLKKYMDGLIKTMKYIDKNYFDDPVRLVNGQYTSVSFLVFVRASLLKQNQFGIRYYFRQEMTNFSITLYDPESDKMKKLPFDLPPNF